MADSNKGKFGDSLPNILAAHSCGWHAVQYLDAARLEADLGEFEFQ